MVAPMISYAQFGKLRLSDFLPLESISPLADWEFMEHLWMGEACGFSEWLRLESDPEVLRSLAIDFNSFPAKSAAKVLKAIDLPLSKGMTIDELRKTLGEPYEKLVFAKDRATSEFRTTRPKYNLSCTVLNDGGLVYLVVMAPFGSQSARKR